MTNLKVDSNFKDIKDLAASSYSFLNEKERDQEREMLYKEKQKQKMKPVMGSALATSEHLNNGVKTALVTGLLGLAYYYTKVAVNHEGYGGEFPIKTEAMDLNRVLTVYFMRLQAYRHYNDSAYDRALLDCDLILKRKREMYDGHVTRDYYHESEVMAWAQSCYASLKQLYMYTVNNNPAEAAEANRDIKEIWHYLKSEISDISFMCRKANHVPFTSKPSSSQDNKSSKNKK